MMDLFIFDMGGVLAGNCDIVPEAVRRLGISEDRFREHALPDMDSYMAGRMGPNEFWDRFRSRAGVLAPENYWATLFHPALDVAMESLALGLKSFGRVVCGTNTLDVHYDVLRTGGFYDCFDAVYASNFLGVCKPDPEFWRRILAAEGRHASRAFFVDDLEENVQAARSLGIRSHRFTSLALLARDLEKSGIRVASGSAAT